MTHKLSLMQVKHPFLKDQMGYWITNIMPMKIVMLTHNTMEKNKKSYLLCWRKIIGHQISISKPYKMVTTDTWLPTTVYAEVLLQMVLVFEGFPTLGAFELAVSSPFVQHRRLQGKQRLRDKYMRKTIILERTRWIALIINHFAPRFKQQSVS